MAITKNENIISNLSYTEKDFQLIYPALLDLVKKETSKWDPSASNESDPGVLLLKLNAIIADKCNYNIDKNVLECFPISVTQDKNARQIFEQLGYYMHWYQAAQVALSLKYIGEDRTDSTGTVVVASYKIPRFTMVCDDEGQIVYTIVDNKSITTDGATQLFTALQGTAVTYDINGSTTITTANLDSNNRLYFTVNNVAENGVYIHNIGADNYSSWEKKDNLLVEEVKSTNYYYKFGVSQDLNSCYLEFPENAEELFQDGIEITYIQTAGEDGNIAVEELERFYSDLSITDPLDSSATIELNSDNVRIKNFTSAISGVNPETISDAYTNYKKTVGTFETLVTLRDYLNAVIKSDYVSNALVLDRTNDIQTSYGIISNTGLVNQLVNQVQEIETVDYTGYLYNNKFYYDNEYREEITPTSYKTYQDIPTGNTYCVNYVDGELSYIESDPFIKPAMESFDIKLYILSASALMKKATNYNTTFDLNVSSTVDDMVKLELEDLKSIQHNYKDILPDKICFLKNKYPVNCKIIPQYALTEAQKLEVAENVRLALYKNLNSSQIEFGQEISYDDIYSVIVDADSRIKTVLLDTLTYSTYAVFLTETYVDPLDLTKGTYITTKELDISNYKTTGTGASKELDNTGDNKLINDWRMEIYAKSVLAGKTQFYVKDSKFDYGINQQYQLLEDDIGQLDTNLTVDFKAENNWEYQVRENETIQLFAPNLLESATYSSNIKFEYKFNIDEDTGLPHTVLADVAYMLTANEWMAFYYTDESLSGSGYNCIVYGEGTIIRPSFKLDSAVSTVEELVGKGIIKAEDSETGKNPFIKDITVNSQTYKFYSGDTVELYTYEDIYPDLKNLGTNIYAMTESYQLLSDGKQVCILLKNYIKLDSPKYYCYWVLNERQGDEYVLFEAGTVTKRILKTGEYFIYTGPSKTDMYVLGSGTLITRNEEFQDRYACTAIDYSEIVEGGISVLNNYWVNQLSADNKKILELLETQYIALSGGAIVRMEPLPDEEGKKNDFSIDSNTEEIPTCTISYKTSPTDTKYVPVAQVLLDNDDYAWSAKALFRLNLSTDLPQVILEGQSVKYYFYDADNEHVITQDDVDEGLYPATKAPGLIDPGDEDNPFHIIDEETGEVKNVYLLASRLIDDIGPTISTIIYDTNDEPVPVSIYAYVLGKMSDNVLIDTDSGTTTITIHSILKDNEEEVSFKLPGGKYIMPLTHSTDDDIISSLHVYMTSTGDTRWHELAPMEQEEIEEPEYAVGEEYSLEDIIVYSGILYKVLRAVGSSENIGWTQFMSKPIDESATINNYTINTEYAKDDYIKYTRSSSNTSGNNIIYKVSSDITAAENTDFDAISAKLTEWVIVEEVEYTAYYNLFKSGNYYLNIAKLPDSEQATSPNFFVTIKVRMSYKETPESLAKAKVITIAIPPIFKYSDSTALDEENDTFNKKLLVEISKKIKELDFNGLFNYTYEVDTDEEIANPLLPSSYLNSDHVMNKYTICQMNTSSTVSDIYITNTVRN